MFGADHYERWRPQIPHLEHGLRNRAGTILLSRGITGFSPCFLLISQYSPCVFIFFSSSHAFPFLIRYYAVWSICTHKGSSIETVNQKTFYQTIMVTSEYPTWVWPSIYPRVTWFEGEQAPLATWVSVFFFLNYPMNHSSLTVYLLKFPLSSRSDRQ